MLTSLVFFAQQLRSTLRNPLTRLLPLETRSLLSVVIAWVVINSVLLFAWYALFAFHHDGDTDSDDAGDNTTPATGGGGGNGASSGGTSGGETQSSKLIALSGVNDESRCRDSRTALFGYVSDAVKVVLLFVGSVVALQVRKIPLHFAESRVMLVAVRTFCSAPRAPIRKATSRSSRVFLSCRISAD